MSIVAIAALLVLCGLFADLAAKLTAEAPDVVAEVGPPPSPSAAVPTLPTPPTPSEPTARTPAVQFATDDKGFVNSQARCAGTQTAAAIGRTERSVVVICAGANGNYEYRGVRLSDEAVLRTAAESTSTRGFLARAANVTYAVSATELLVTAGATVIKQEAMLEYRD